MNKMTEAAKQRMKDFVSASTKVALDTCEAHGYPTYDEKLCILADEISEASYKAGMQDPDAGKHECDDTCQRDMNIECPISYPKVLVSKELLDECEKVLLIAWGQLEAGCKEAEQVDQMIEKIREARK